MAAESAAWPMGDGAAPAIPDLVPDELWSLGRPKGGRFPAGKPEAGC